MADYKTGHVKRDPATGAIAIRTEFPEVGHLVVHAWLVATIASGAILKITADVDGWDDLYTPAD